MIFIGLLASIVLASCHSHDGESDHAHSPDGTHVTHDDTDLEPLVYTLYTDKTELFVEFKPLVVGEETRFAAHFTSLGETFTAISEGSVTLSLTGNAGTQSTTSDAPEVPGIFRLRMTPEKAGPFKLVFDIKTPGYSDQITVDSVAVYADEKTALEKQLAPDGGSSTITYLKEQAWKVDFANIPVKRTSFYDVVKTSGLVATAPGTEQTVVARTPGIVSFISTNLMTGSSVGAGQRLFTISSKGFTIDNAPLKLQEAKIALDKANADVERLQRLLIDQLTTRREFLQAKTALDNAQALYNSLSGSYGPDGQSISSAQGGFIKSLFVTPGQFVEAGQPLAVISKNKRLTVKADLSQIAFAKTGNIASANFRINNQTVYSLQELNGSVLSIGKFADNSMFIPIWFEIDNREGIIPGTYIEVFIHTNTVDNALVIPIAALLEEQGNYYCYVQMHGESFEKRELMLGASDGKQVHVLSGLQEGDRVVTKGAYNIKLSSTSGTLPAHGHEH